MEFKEKFKFQGQYYKKRENSMRFWKRSLNKEFF